MSASANGQKAEIASENAMESMLFFEIDTAISVTRDSFDQDRFGNEFWTPSLVVPNHLAHEDFRIIGSRNSKKQ